MDITGISEKPNMIGGDVLFELTFEPEEGSAVSLDLMHFHEAYSGNILWVWSQSPLDEVLSNRVFWEILADGLRYNGIRNVPSPDEFIEMAYNRLEIGNEPDFALRMS